jgi:Rrf2 family protein
MMTKKSKYALKALLFLTKERQKGDVNKLSLIGDIAEKESIPKKFLETILLELKNQRLVISERGKTGGYRLAQAPDVISVGNIIRIIDGPLAPVACVSHLYYKKCDECIDENTCEIRMVMKNVRDAICEILDKTSLLELSKTGDIAKVIAKKKTTSATKGKPKK